MHVSAATCLGMLGVEFRGNLADKGGAVYVQNVGGAAPSLCEVRSLFVESCQGGCGTT